MKELIESQSPRSINTVLHLLEIAEQAQIHMNLWETQNLFHLFLNGEKPNDKDKNETAAPPPINQQIVKLAERLSYCIGQDSKFRIPSS